MVTIKNYVKNITTAFTAVLFGIIFVAPASAIPVQRDLYVTDSEFGNIFAVSPSKVITLLVSEADIMAATGASSARFTDNGMYYDQATDNLYFTDSESDSILVRDTFGTISVIASAADITAVTGEGANPEHITFLDGFLYVTDSSSDTLLKVNVNTNAVALWTNEVAFETSVGDGKDVDIESGIAISKDGKSIYIGHDKDRSSDTTGAIFKVDIATGTPSVLIADVSFDDFDTFLTLAPNGDIIVSDDAGVFGGEIFRITPTGVVTMFLSGADLNALGIGTVDLEGGIIFDEFGNFYLAEENTDNIYRWLVDDLISGTILNGSGALFISEADVVTALGLSPNRGVDYEGGIVFGRAAKVRGVPEPAPLALIGFGLLGLGLARKYHAK